MTRARLQRALAGAALEAPIDLRRFRGKQLQESGGGGGDGDRTEPMRKSTLDPVVGRLAEYMLDSVTEQTLKRLISSGENTLNSTALMYSRRAIAGRESGETAPS